MEITPKWTGWAGQDRNATIYTPHTHLVQAGQLVEDDVIQASVQVPEGAHDLGGGGTRG